MNASKDQNLLIINENSKNKQNIINSPLPPPTISVSSSVSSFPRIHLKDGDLWKMLYEKGNEMFCALDGRKLFPRLEFEIEVDHDETENSRFYYCHDWDEILPREKMGSKRNNNHQVEQQQKELDFDIGVKNIQRNGEIQKQILSLNENFIGVEGGALTSHVNECDNQSSFQAVENSTESQTTIQIVARNNNLLSANERNQKGDVNQKRYSARLMTSQLLRTDENTVKPADYPSKGTKIGGIELEALYIFKLDFVQSTSSKGKFMNGSWLFPPETRISLEDLVQIESDFYKLDESGTSRPSPLTMTSSTESQSQNEVLSSQVFEHPDGAWWINNGISFKFIKMKNRKPNTCLTESDLLDSNKNIFLAKTNFKFIPRLYVQKISNADYSESSFITTTSRPVIIKSKPKLQSNKSPDLKIDSQKMVVEDEWIYMFKETEFIPVTRYVNPEIKLLKIKVNPHAYKESNHDIINKNSKSPSNRQVQRKTKPRMKRNLEKENNISKVVLTSFDKQNGEFVMKNQSKKLKTVMKISDTVIPKPIEEQCSDNIVLQPTNDGQTIQGNSSIQFVPSSPQFNYTNPSSNETCVDRMNIMNISLNLSPSQFQLDENDDPCPTDGLDMLSSYCTRILSEMDEI